MNDLTTMYQHHRAEYSLSVFLTFSYSRSLEKCQSLSFCCSSATVSRRMVFETARSFVINFDTEILCLCAQSLQSCPTLRGTVDRSLPNSSVHGFSSQEYWSGLPFPPPGGLPDSGFEPASPTLAGEFFTSEPPGKPHRNPGVA